MRITVRPHSSHRDSRSGVAIVIILAFVVLLTGLVVAFFSRSVIDRQISNGSASRAKVSAFADGASNAIIGELKQEIVYSSSATGPITSGTTVFLPLTAAAMLPQLSGTSTTTPPPNLLKISAPGQPFYSGTSAGVTVPATAITVSSTTPSLNGRYVTPARWNSHYLLPLLSSTDATPVSTGSGAFIPPSWVLVARNGTNPITWSQNMVASGTNAASVVGRYAFAVYHEGGLLDANVAGYPAASGVTGTSGLVTYKNALAMADLTQIPGLTGTAITTLVGWRNYASIPVPGSNPFFAPAFTSLSASNYFKLVLSNTTGFMKVSGAAAGNGETDQMFASRQELIKFVENGLGLSGTSLNALNYLATFTRDINQPSYHFDSAGPVVVAPAVGGNNSNTAGNSNDGYINPGKTAAGTVIYPAGFLSIQVQTAFTRNDGSQAVAGEPFVKKRFALNRLAWLTCNGAIADDSGNLNPSSDPTIQNIITQLIALGVPTSLLSQGGPTNIQTLRLALGHERDAGPLDLQCAQRGLGRRTQRSDYEGGRDSGARQPARRGLLRAVESGHQCGRPCKTIYQYGDVGQLCALQHLHGPRFDQPGGLPIYARFHHRLSGHSDRRQYRRASKRGRLSHPDRL